jgi:antitoxin HicB
MATETTRTDERVADLLARPYRMEVRGDPEEGYLATAPELPGCMTAGETPTEALELLRDAMATWLESAIAHGDPIPEPAQASKDDYSGRLLLRMPKTLHRDLAAGAEREGVSLNQHVVSLLSTAVGSDTPAGGVTKRVRLRDLPSDADVSTALAGLTQVNRQLAALGASPLRSTLEQVQKTLATPAFRQMLEAMQSKAVQDALRAAQSPALQEQLRAAQAAIRASRPRAGKAEQSTVSSEVGF